MTIRMRLTERPNWTKLGTITNRFTRANKIATAAIRSELGSHAEDPVTDLYGQLDPLFQKYQSARQLQSFPDLVKVTRLSGGSFFFGIQAAKLHAWQMQFSEKQLHFLKYAARASGVTEVGVAILPPTPFTVDLDVGVDQDAIASNFYKGLGLGAGGRRGGRVGKFGKMAKKAGSAVSSFLGRLFSRRSSSTKTKMTRNTGPFSKGGRGKSGRDTRGRFSNRK